MMLGKRTYCILGTMLLAFASLGAGVTAEQNNEQMADLEELGVLELSLSEDGVIDAVITADALFALLEMDEDEMPAIESIAMSISLSDDGEILFENYSIDLGEEQSDEISITLRLSEELLEILQDEDMHHLLVDLGFGDDLGLDDFNPEVGDWDEDMERIDWADAAYQIRGSQADYERVLDSEDAGEEFYRVLEEFEENYDTYAEDTLGARLHWADDAYQLRGCQADYDRVMDSEDPEGEFYNISAEVNAGWEEDSTESEEEGPEEWNETPIDEEEQEARDDICTGFLRGTITVNDEGNGSIAGVVMDEDGNIVAEMWGSFNADGFATGFGGEDNSTEAMWKAVYDDGRFNGLWRSVSEDSDARGILKGHYDIDLDGTGVYEGKWKEQGCEHDEMDEREDREHLPIDDMQPRHTPLQVDSDRVDVRPVEITPKQKPLMDKLGDVMDKPLVEDSEGGTIVDLGEAAAGSTLGTIALLGAGFLRRRITGGL